MIPDEIKPKQIEIANIPEHENFITWLEQNYTIKKKEVRDGTLYIELED